MKSSKILFLFSTVLICLRFEKDKLLNKNEFELQDVASGRLKSPNNKNSALG